MPSDVDSEFDPDSGAYTVYHAPDSSWKVTTTVVHSISELTGYEPTQMLPLNRAVDPDVLESHVRGRDRGAQLSFEFHGYHVTVRDDGEIRLSPLEEREV